MQISRLEGLKGALGADRWNHDLARSLDRIEDALTKHWSVTYLHWFTNHGVRHSFEVARIALEIADAPDLPPHLRLSTLEQYLLVAAALLHDIGMNDQSALLGYSDEAPVRLQQQIRHEHPARSAQLILDQPQEWGLPEEAVLAEMVALLTQSHGTKYYSQTVQDLEKRSRVRNSPVRAQLLAALLLMADELDLYYGRESPLPGGRRSKSHL
jgi:hypothetical protein